MNCTVLLDEFDFFMTDCLFCKIVNKEIPNYTVYEDAHNLAFLDIQPHAKGHTVVIPKQHGEFIFDFSDQVFGQLGIAMKKAMEKIDAVLKPDGYSVGWNHGEAGGQVVPHLHVHIMPRWKGDGGGNMHSIINDPGDAAVGDLAILFQH